MSGKQIEVTQSAYQYPLLIKQLLKTSLNISPEKEIVYRDKFRYDYNGLHRRICRLANALGDLGIKRGDTVAVMDWDSHRFLECFFAIPMIGAILHTVNVRLTPEQIAYTVNHAEDVIILANSDFFPMLEKVKDDLQSVNTIVAITDDSKLPETTLSIHSEYEALISDCPDDYVFPDFEESVMATCFFTTGTTGLPKGVYFSHRQIVLHTYGLMSAFCAYKTHYTFDSGDVYMPITPMFHVHAWGLPYLATMLGNKQVYPGRYEPETLLSLIEKEKVTYSHCVPTIIHMLLDSPSIDRVDLSGWKVSVGGSAVPRSLCSAAMERGINIFGGYGMSESCPLLTLSNLKEHMLEWDMEQQIDVRRRAGLPIPLVEIEIIDPIGKPIPKGSGHAGEIVVRTPWLTMGYLNAPEKSEELWEESWMHTGDIGFFDNEGYLHITDRVKDVIKTGGEWISSIELEDIICSHPAVSEAAAIGISDNKWGERPMVFVVLKKNLSPALSEQVSSELMPTEEDLRAFYETYVEKGVLPKYGVPGRIRIVEDIPKTSVGKLNKKALRTPFRQSAQTKE